MRRLFALAALPVALIVSGCAGGPEPASRAGATPALVLEDWLQGRTYAIGVFERGQVLDRKFYVEIDGDWNGRALTLDERFLYDDGMTDRRVWTMEQVADGRFIGTANDVIGQADIAVVGDAAFFDYVVDLKLQDGSTVEVRFTDRIYQISRDMIINRATVSKFGLDLGEVAIVFTKDRPSDWPDIEG